MAPDCNEISDVSGVLVSLFADCVDSEDCGPEDPSGVEGSSLDGSVSTVVVAALPVFSPIKVSFGAGRVGEDILPADVIFASLALVVTFNGRYMYHKIFNRKLDFSKYIHFLVLHRNNCSLRSILIFSIVFVSPL